MNGKTQVAALKLDELYAMKARLLSYVALELVSCTNDQSLVPGLRLLAAELDKLAEDILTIEPARARLFGSN